jgi:protein-S-isoprenylcysteine O-methyltransferase Ste14
MLWRVLLTVPWVVFCVIWLIGALKTKRTVSKEPFSGRLGIVAMEFLGFVLVFTSQGNFGRQAIVPQTFGMAAAGVACTWLGVGLAVWARWYLGRNWSARVTLKEDHQLIRTGPYAYFRHPIYSGLDLAAIGGALAIDEWRCVAGAFLVVTGYWLKARREESMLAAQFGSSFEEHCRHTGFLLPKF